MQALDGTGGAKGRRIVAKTTVYAAGPRWKPASASAKMRKMSVRGASQHAGPSVSDLYVLLGVQPDANLAAIRRAFRKKVRSCHPDGGGSAEAFHELKTAYDVLSDPLRRRRYDETGEIGDQASGDPRQAKTIEILSVAFDQALLKLNASGAWRPSDILPATARILASSRSDAARHRQSFEAALEQAKSFKERFRNASGENLMEIVVARRISACLQKIDLLDEHIEIMDDALRILMSTDVTPQLQIGGETAPQDAQAGQANISPLLDISSLIKFR